MSSLISIADLDRNAVEEIIARAQSFSEVGDRQIKKVPALRGQTVVNLFYEASTRTSSSFELAAKRLSADVINIRADGSSIEKGESLKDTVHTLTAYGPAAFVVRTPHVGAAKLVSQYTDAAVINAGDGKHEHPTQALLDLYTLKQHFDDLTGLKVWIVGDVMHSRVARSNVLAMNKLGIDVTVVGPPTLVPRDFEKLGCRVRYDLAGVEEADVIYTLRIQHERMDGGLLASTGEYVRNYQINGSRLRAGQLVMHPGPVNRGVELSAEIIDGGQTLINEQVAAGLAVRMAVLYQLLAAGTQNDVEEGAA